MDVNWETDSPDVTNNGITVGFLRNGKTITGLKVSKGNTQRVADATGGSCKYYFWGGATKRFLAFYTISAPAADGRINRVISLFDLNDANLSSILVTNTNFPINVSLPTMQVCSGSTGGFVFVKTNLLELNRINASIFSAKGAPTNASLLNHLLQGANPLTAVTISETDFSINRNYVNVDNPGTTLASGSLEGGLPTFNPSKLEFNEVTVGASLRKTFTIKNESDNCITINSIVDAEHYKVINPISETTLQLYEEKNIEVEFTPTEVITFDENLTVKGPTAAEVIATFNCKGEGKLPTFSIIGSLNFGKVPVLTSKTNIIKIKNTSDVVINYSVTASPIGSPFSWSAIAGTLNPGATSGNISITFNSPEIPSDSPLIVSIPLTKSYSKTFKIKINNITTNHTLSATSCRAQPRISIEKSLLDFGFNFGNTDTGSKKTTKITIKNPGSGILNYSARIIPVQGNPLQINPGIFKLQKTDSTNARTYTTLTNLKVNPSSPCGNITPGNGEGSFYVSFKATGITGTVNAFLEIFDHNVGDGTAFNLYRITLTAKIKPLLNH